MEVMVVVVIIGLLAGAVALRVRHYVDKAKLQRARSDISTIVSAVEAFYADKSRYPTNEEGLTALPLTTLKDPWGRPYQYNCPGHDHPYEVVTYGADGREGGDGEDADLFSWNLEDK
jgi:general secretion pathway protein G